MTTAQRFRQYLQIIPPNERDAWIFATLGHLHDEIDRLKKEIAKLKAHNTRQKKAQNP
jgi:ubiquinone biosynthesis protein UbiJ